MAKYLRKGFPWDFDSAQVPRQGVRNPSSWVDDIGTATVQVLGDADQVKVCPHLHVQAFAVDALLDVALQIYEDVHSVAGRRGGAEDRASSSAASKVAAWSTVAAQWILCGEKGLLL
jgi:hypothetical protein